MLQQGLLGFTQGFQLLGRDPEQGLDSVNSRCLAGLLELEEQAACLQQDQQPYIQTAVFPQHHNGHPSIREMQSG